MYTKICTATHKSTLTVYIILCSRFIHQINQRFSPNILLTGLVPVHLSGFRLLIVNTERVTFTEVKRGKEYLERKLYERDGSDVQTGKLLVPLVLYSCTNIRNTEEAV